MMTFSCFERGKQLKSDGSLKFIQLLPLTINLRIRYGSVELLNYIMSSQVKNRIRSVRLVI